MEYIKYKEYKNSGTKWFEVIPSDWDVRPIKHLAKTIPGGTPSTSNLEYWENGNIPWLPSGMVQNCQINEQEAYKFITEKGLLNSATKYIGPESVLVALTGATCANIGFLTFKATANQSVISVEPYTSVSKYIYYALLSQREQILNKKTGGAQSGINEEDVKSILIPIMSIPEQYQIANYLDKQTAKIDTNIAKNDELIQLLEEKRAALIKQVVTKGLNPDAPMKDSGVEWIGEIPKDWEADKLKKYFYIHNGSTPKDNEDNWNGDICWVTPADYKTTDIYINQSSRQITKTGLNSCGTTLVPKGSIIVSNRAPIGTVAIANVNLCTNQGCKSLAIKRKINTKFVYYSLSINEKELNKLGRGTTFMELSSYDLGTFKIPIAPYSEQNSIVNYLDKETSKIDQTVSKIKENIELLNEYKSSLIHHVVTGKIDVRGEVI